MGGINLKQFLYISLVCGVIAGAGIFFNVPHYPTRLIPQFIALIGVISAILTLKDHKTSGLLSLGGVMINLMPLLASIVGVQQ